MVDCHIEKPLQVSNDGTAGPYIIVPSYQLDRVHQILTKNGIQHQIDKNAISIDGRPEVSVVNLGRKGDPVLVQKILEQIF